MSVEPDRPPSDDKDEQSLTSHDDDSQDDHPQSLVTERPAEVHKQRDPPSSGEANMKREADKSFSDSHSNRSPQQHVRGSSTAAPMISPELNNKDELENNPGCTEHREEKRLGMLHGKESKSSLDTGGDNKPGILLPEKDVEPNSAEEETDQSFEAVKVIDPPTQQSCYVERRTTRPHEVCPSQGSTPGAFAVAGILASAASGSDIGDRLSGDENGLALPDDNAGDDDDTGSSSSRRSCASGNEGSLERWQLVGDGENSPPHESTSIAVSEIDSSPPGGIPLTLMSSQLAEAQPVFENDAATEAQVRRFADQSARNMFPVAVPDLPHDLSPVQDERQEEQEETAWTNKGQNPRLGRHHLVWLLASLLVIGLPLVVVLVLLLRREGNAKPGDSSSLLPDALNTTVELYRAVDAYLNGEYDGSPAEEINLWDVSRLENFSHVFSVDRNGAAAKFNGPLGGWDVSRAITFKAMFRGAAHFRQDLSAWNVSSRARTIREMFEGATAFDSDLSAWYVSMITDMRSTFNGASSFRGRGLSEWDVSNAVSLDLMFNGSTLFNGNISNWNISSCTSTRGMFSGASSFNRDVSHWRTTEVRLMNKMFQNAVSFDQNLSAWDVSSVSTMKQMFDGASNFSGIGLSTWNLSRVKTFNNMFRGAVKFDENLSSWRFKQLVNMRWMFSGAKAFQGIGLDQWETSGVCQMGSVFYEASNFQADLSRWDTSSATAMGRMFYMATKFNSDISSWQVSRVHFMRDMFHGATSFNQDLSSWQPKACTDMIGEANTVQKQKLSYGFIL